MLNRSELADPVTQIEDVRTVGERVQDRNLARVSGRAGTARFNKQRIKIALHGQALRQFRIAPSSGSSVSSMPHGINTDLARIGRQFRACAFWESR